MTEQGKKEKPVLLLTGFEPFGGSRVNASWEMALFENGRTVAGHRVVAAQLPVVFGECTERLREQIGLHKPAIIICLGEADRGCISIERSAVNLIDARIADNRGNMPRNAPVISGGPTGYFSTLPINAMRDAVEETTVPVELSKSAGHYVCNALFYGLMHELSVRRDLAHVRGGFVHVPLMREQKTKKPVDFNFSIYGLDAVIEAAITAPRRPVLQRSPFAYPTYEDS